MYKTDNLGLNITEMDKDGNHYFNFDTDLNQNFLAIDKLALSHRNITNCLLEVPENIKYTLINGTLTIKAGSIVVIPYGVEDLSLDYTIGSAFINGNFKIVDTQFTNGKFFIFVELVNDISIQYANGAYSLVVYLFIDNNSIAIFNTQSNSSGSTEPTTGVNFYNTATNFMNRYSAEGIKDSKVCSLPLLICKSSSTSIVSVEEVFQGYSYIGSTFFTLPNIQGLIADGRNEDETFKNIQNKTNEVFVFTLTSTSTSGTYVLSIVDNTGGGFTGLDFKPVNSIIYQKTNPNASRTWWFDEIENQWKYIHENLSITKRWWMDFGVANITNGIITSFNPKKPFQAVDFNDYQSKITELETKIATLQAAVEALQG